MPYFLDGNNLIGAARGTARPSEEDRVSLVRELCDRLRRTRARAVLFFDGPPPGGGASDLGTLSLRYAGGQPADDRIVDEISRGAAPADIVVVTGDRALARRAKEAGARAMTPKDFWERFGAAASAPAEGPSVDVDEWLRYFSDDRNRR